MTKVVLAMLAFASVIAVRVLLAFLIQWSMKTGDFLPVFGAVLLLPAAIGRRR